MARLLSVTKEYFDGRKEFDGVDFYRRLAETIWLNCRDFGIAHPESIRQRDEVLKEAAAEAYRKERDGE